MTLQLHVDYLCLTCVYGINFLSINWVLRLQYMCNTLNSTLSYIIFYCLDQTECESTRSNEWGEPCEVWSIWIHGTFTCRKLIINFISFYVLKLLCCSCRLLSLSLQLYISCKWLHFKMQCKLIMTWSNSSIEKLIFPYSCTD